LERFRFGADPFIGEAIPNSVDHVDADAKVIGKFSGRLLGPCGRPYLNNFSLAEYSLARALRLPELAGEYVPNVGIRDTELRGDIIDLGSTIQSPDLINLFRRQLGAARYTGVLIPLDLVLSGRLPGKVPLVDAAEMSVPARVRGLVFGRRGRTVPVLAHDAMDGKGVLADIGISIAGPGEWPQKAPILARVIEVFPDPLRRSAIAIDEVETDHAPLSSLLRMVDECERVDVPSVGRI
jgi:hypothetical protein